ncbi:MAG: FecR domain-containing protein [Bacteroidales bacterium]|jgi:ferric-dicitrate binding protein FerR (iron transport regulator)
MKKKDEHIDFVLLTKFLAGEAGSEEQAKVRKWISASGENRREFELLQKSWNLTEKTDPVSEINIDREWEHHRAILYASGRTGRKLYLKALVRIAAAIIIGVGLILAGIKYSRQYAVKTKYAETTKIELPDGSVVTLNAGSRLTYSKNNFGKENRTVNLRGEAYFEVEKDIDRPFIIRLDKAEIRVLGTAFNVRAYRKMDAIEVTVSEGKVSLYDKDVKHKKVIAVTGEKAEFDKQLNIVKKYQNTDRNYISWKTRNMVFHNDSLGIVTGILENVYHKEIVLEGQGLGNCTFTTSFENEDLQTVLKVLESTLDLEIREDRNKIIISGEGC